MLNLIKLKNFYVKPKIVKSEGNTVATAKHYPSPIQEWKDSIYTFNKNSNKITPLANVMIMNLTKSYFNMYNIKLEKRVNLLHMRTWKRRLLGRNIWISKPELKHTNDNIIINLYVYNRQYAFLLKKLSKLKLTWGQKFKVNLRKAITKKTIKLAKTLFKDKFKRVIDKVKIKSTKFKILYKWDLIESINTTNINQYFNINAITYVLKKWHRRFLIKMLKYQGLYMRHRQIILFNKLKFKDAYLIPLRSLIQKIYNKKVEFNFISIKSFNLNSSIFSQIIAYKMKNRRNKPLKVIRTSIKNTKLPYVNKYLHVSNQYTKDVIKQNYIIRNFFKNYYHDFFNNILSNELSKNNIQDIVYSSTKNKLVTGIKVQASGRITRRLIAQRAKCNVVYKGTLKNIDSSYKGLSNVILKGNNRSNIQYTNFNYKRRIGAFGIKGWISSY